MTAPLWLVVLTGIASAFAGAVTSFVALRKDRRENRDSEREAAAETIRLLKEQKDLLVRQGEAREAEWQRRETAWIEEKRTLSERIDRLEDHNRDTLMMITKMGLCADANVCDDYNPGDRKPRG